MKVFCIANCIGSTRFTVFYVFLFFITAEIACAMIACETRFPYFYIVQDAQVGFFRNNIVEIMLSTIFPLQPFARARGEGGREVAGACDAFYGHEGETRALFIVRISYIRLKIGARACPCVLISPSMRRKLITRDGDT